MLVLKLGLAPFFWLPFYYVFMLIQLQLSICSSMVVFLVVEFCHESLTQQGYFHYSLVESRLNIDLHFIFGLILFILIWFELLLSFISDAQRLLDRIDS